MERFYYEIMHTDEGAANAEQLRRLIAADPLLAKASEPWTRETNPAAAELFALVLIVSNDLASDVALLHRLNSFASCGAPVIPIVSRRGAYDIHAAPLPLIAERNLLGLDEPEAIIAALLHHGGLRHHGTGGRVMISYARADGQPLCEALREELRAAGFRCFVDVHEIAGGAPLRAEIRREIERSDLVVLVDSPGAKRSRWVAEERDMALNAHVPVIVVGPSDSASCHVLDVPREPWDPGDDERAVAERTASRARRLLAKKRSFGERVRRVLEQLCRLRGWQIEDAPPHLLLRPVPRDLRVAWTDGLPDAVAVEKLREVVGAEERGLLVGGTRSYPQRLATALARAGAPVVRVAPLSRLATRVSDDIALDALRDRRILLSAAMPDEPQQHRRASELLPNFVVILIQTMFELGVTLVYGGHPSITPLVHRSVEDSITDDSGRIELHQGRYWFDRGQLPQETSDRRVFARVCLHGRGEEPVEDLDALRGGMICQDLDGAVFVGGALVAPIGGQPGVIVEYERFCRVCPSQPAFVVGLGEGAAASLLARKEPASSRLDPRIAKVLGETRDPDLAVALIVAELLERFG